MEKKKRAKKIELKHESLVSTPLACLPIRTLPHRAWFKAFKDGRICICKRGVSPSTGGVASAYGNESEKKPSWLQTNKSDIDGKYDKYGERRNAHTTTRDSRLDRLKRVRQKLAEREDVGHEGDEGDEDEVYYLIFIYKRPILPSFTTRNRKTIVRFRVGYRIERIETSIVL